jgi:TatD DNase family protein
MSHVPGNPRHLPPTTHQPPLAQLVDTHAHLDDRRLRADLPAILDRAASEGVTQIIAIGTTAASSSGALELARLHQGIFAAVGVHPNDAAEVGQNDWPLLLEMIGRPGLVAIGETGLDRYWNRTPFGEQQQWFDRHLALAREFDLPIVIHCRDCQNDIIEQLKLLGRSIRGVMHSFTGSWDDAQAYLELGLHLSFAGMITFSNKSLDALRQVAARMPLDRLLVETDSPYLTPDPFRGKMNEPARVALTAAKIAEIRGLGFAELAEISTKNARALFRLPETETLSVPSSPERANRREP